MKTIKIFLASSAELLEDRKEFEILLNRKNIALIKEGVFLELVIWENFLDFLSETRLQDEYNKVLKECDLFIMLFYTKVGKYTKEEFDTAYQQFKANKKPLILTYFKDAPTETARQDSLKEFQGYLGSLGHFFTVYKNIEGLKLHFGDQLDKLEQRGFFKSEKSTSDGEKEEADAKVSDVDLKVLKVINMKIANGDDISKILMKHSADLVKLSPGKSDELNLLQGRAKKLERNIRINLISSADAGVEQARNSAALLDILSEIKSEQGM